MHKGEAPLQAVVAASKGKEQTTLQHKILYLAPACVHLYYMPCASQLKKWVSPLQVGNIIQQHELAMSIWTWRMSVHCSGNWWWDVDQVIMLKQKP